MDIKELHIFALASHGVGISGGDRIWIELVRRWSNNFPVTIHTWTEGKEMGKRQKLQMINAKSQMLNGKRGLFVKLYDIGILCNLGFVICYLARIIKGIWVGLTIKLENDNSTYLYNASEFWMDAFPCILLKIRYPKITWIATWYQTAPNPFKGYVEQGTENREQRTRNKKYFLKAFAYWFVQLPVKPLIKKYADKVIVNNENERKQFPKNETIVLIGAVPLEGIKKYQKQKAQSKKPIYDAVFQGRFHAQKGVVELIEIWKEVVKEKPKAQLAMIGNGPLMDEVMRTIKKNALTDNIKLFGFVFDGDEKYRIFSGSKMVVHPAFYDSGGMATAEAMAFGIPAIGFNLEAYDSYYPKGMVKVKDENEFAKKIITFLIDENLRERIGKEAKDLIEKSYSWDVRASEILNAIQ